MSENKFRREFYRTSIMKSEKINTIIVFRVWFLFLVHINGVREIVDEHARWIFGLPHEMMRSDVSMNDPFFLIQKTPTNNNLFERQHPELKNRLVSDLQHSS